MASPPLHTSFSTNIASDVGTSFLSAIILINILKIKKQKKKNDNILLFERDVIFI